MNAKKGVLLSISLLLLFGPGLAFYDDFQEYNSVNDPLFMSNYTIVSSGDGGFSISQAPSDSLALYATIDTGSAALWLNATKYNYSAPFDISFNIRPGSSFLASGMTFYFYLNNTGENFTLNGLHGYYLTYASGYCTLTRFEPGSSVVLDTKACTPMSTNDIVTFGTDENYNASIYLNGTLVYSANDSVATYTHGNVMIKLNAPGGIYSSYGWLDNFNDLPISVTPATSSYNNASNWHILGWLNNIENLPGYYQSASHNLFNANACYWSFKDADLCILTCQLGLHENCHSSIDKESQIRINCGTYTCDVTNITYSLHGSTVTETTNSPLGSGYDDYAVPNKYYDSITAYFYVLGQPFTESIRAGIHILPYMRLKASASGCSYVSPQKWVAIAIGSKEDLTQYEAPIPTTNNNYYWGGNYWKHDNSGDYLVSQTFGFICTNSNNITVSYDFYNTQTGTLLFTKDATFPIGYVVNCTGIGIGSSCTPDYTKPFDCVFNASLCSGAGNLPTFNTTCTPGVNCPVPGGDGAGLNIDWGGLSGLLTPTTVLLVAVLFFGAIVTRDTKSSQIGLIVVLAGVLLLSFYGFLPWYITILITIGAAMFLVTEIRGGIFGRQTTA